MNSTVGRYWKICEMHEKSLDSLEEITIYIKTDTKDCSEDSEEGKRMRSIMVN